mmetsp:Transcript_30436/g.55302  ORF Transcript_30436/g.55302 Transcript_30436/m.55302 type:complete len:492 (+) Transcript_30436:2-1477(+)
MALSTCFETVNGCLNVARAFGEILDRPEVKEKELRELSVVVRSICKSMQSYFAGHAREEVAQDTFMEAFGHIRKCVDICENHARAKALPHTSEASAVNPTLMQPRDSDRSALSLVSRLKRSASDFGREGLEYLNSYLGRCGGALGLPEDQLAQIREVKTTLLSTYLPLLTFSITCKQTAAQTPPRTTSTVPQEVARVDLLSTQKELRALPGIPEENAIHGRAISFASLSDSEQTAGVASVQSGRVGPDYKRTMSFSSMTEIEDDDHSAETVPEPPTKRARATSSSTQLATDVPQWSFRFVSQADLNIARLPTVTVEDLHVDSKRQVMLGRTELESHLPETLVHPWRRDKENRPVPLCRYVSSKHLFLDLLPALRSAANTESQLTLSLPHAEDEGGETLSLSAEDAEPKQPKKEANVAGSIKPLKFGLHVLRVDTHTWRWIKRGESEVIAEGDTVALILEFKPSSGKSHSEQDMHRHDAICVLGFVVELPAV